MLSVWKYAATHLCLVEVLLQQHHEAASQQVPVLNLLKVRQAQHHGRITNLQHRSAASAELMLSLSGLAHAHVSLASAERLGILLKCLAVGLQQMDPPACMPQLPAGHPAAAALLLLPDARRLQFQGSLRRPGLLAGV